MKMTVKKSLLAATVGLIAAPSAMAVSPADLGLTEQQVRLLTNAGPLNGAGITFGSPTAYGLNWREAGVGVASGYDPDATGKKWDGSIAVSAGLGNAVESVGLETVVGIYSTLNQSGNDDFASDGGVGFKLHTVLPYNSAVAVGVENVARWGDAAKAGRSSVYVVGTKFVALNPKGTNKFPVAINVGLGNGRFTERGSSDDSVNVFGGVAVTVLPRVAVIADWTGRDLNAAVNFAPFSSLPFVASVGAVDITEQDGANTTYAANLGYTFRF